MRYAQKVFPVLAAALLAAGMAQPSFSQASSARATIGVVDRDKVITSYHKAQSAAEELKKSEEKVQRLIEDSNKQYEEAKAARKPPAELEGLQKRLQQQIDGEVRKVQGRAQGLETQLESDIDSAIKAEAASRKVDIVVLKQAVLQGGTDLTDGVIKRLTTAAAAVKSTSAAIKPAPAAK